VGRACEEFEVELHQPETLEREALEGLFRATRAEVGVVVAYGKILRKWLLDLPRFGFLNVHASILPWYRGVAPIARAIMGGEKETGVSIMGLDEGVDTGPVYLVRKTAIGPDETAGELGGRLAVLGAEALLEALEGIEEGKRTPEPQEGESSYAPALEKGDGRIEWNDSAAAIHDRVRGVNPWPGGTVRFREGEVRVWRTSLSEAEEKGAPGEVVRAKKGTLTVMTGEGALDLVELQRPGKKRGPASDFINGMRVKKSEVFS
jgi:methionyl-tRNA formyltransferase